MKDFSAPQNVKPLDFTIDGDVFYASPVCPAGTLVDIANMVNSGTQGEQLDAVMGFLDQVLYEESADLFAERMRSAKRPISIQQTMDVFRYLLEEYNQGFPTEESSRSASGSPTATRPTSARRSSTRAGTRSVETVSSEAV